MIIDYRYSFAYWSNIIFSYGLGMLIDAKNSKRFAYPRRVYLNSADTIGNHYSYGQGNHLGEFQFHFSLPHINTFQLTPENEGTKTNTGFWGLSLGMDYYHNKRQFLNLSVAGVSDFFVPVPAAVDISGEYELMSSRYISVSNNHKIRRFSLGYGLAYARNTWDFRYYDRFSPPPPTRNPIKKSNNSMGLIFSSYFHSGKNFNLGVVYRPTFLKSRSVETFEYEHLISIDLAWKILL